MKNCVCKIYSDGMKSTGFFCKIPFPDKSHLLPVLATTSHSIGDLNKQNSLSISINDDKILKKINLNNMRKVYMNKELDTCFIEILPDDYINDFLEIEDEIFKDENILNYKNKSIYVLHYIESEGMAMNSGLLKSIDKYNISHSCSTSKGSAGAPILTLDNLKVIGIHFGSSKNFRLNIGTFIKYPISEFIKGNKGH